MEKEIQYIKEKVDMLVSAVIGDPSDLTKPGHGIRIDRLEQSSKLFKKLFWILSTGIVFAIIQRFI